MVKVATMWLQGPGSPRASSAAAERCICPVVGDRDARKTGKVKRTSLVGEEPRPATFGQHLSATRCGMQPDPRALCYQVSCGGHRRHDGFNSKQNLGFTHQPAPTHLQHPYEKRPKVSKKMLAERCSTQSSTGREWIPKGAGNGDPWRR